MIGGDAARRHIRLVCTVHNVKEKDILTLSDRRRNLKYGSQLLIEARNFVNIVKFTIARKDSAIIFPSKTSYVIIGASS